MAALDSTVHGQTDEYNPPAPPPVLSPDDNPGPIEGAAHLMLMDIDTVGTTVSGGGAPPSDANGLPDPPTATDPHKQAWQQLISPTTPQDELPSLIETIFSDRKTMDMANPLRASDAQVFIDVIDGVRHHVLISGRLVGYKFDLLHSVARRWVA